ncbi:MAG: hypothetical protein H0X46_04435 [Bacteroidetes bacterium]|nr:hypothetical protein [Bacteroidota bacterium]
MKEKVTYNKVFGILLITGALFILGVSFIIGFSLNTLSGGLLLVMGILYLNNAAIEYDDQEILVKNLYGGTVRSYSFLSDKIELRDGAMYANDSKIRVGAFFLNKEELALLYDMIAKKSI